MQGHVQIFGGYGYVTDYPALVVVSIADTRSRGKADLPQNTALSDIRVDPDTFTVSVDGEVWEPEPVRELPMAQRYFLF